MIANIKVLSVYLLVQTNLVLGVAGATIHAIIFLLFPRYILSKMSGAASGEFSTPRIRFTNFCLIFLAIFFILIASLFHELSGVFSLRDLLRFALSIFSGYLLYCYVSQNSKGLSYKALFSLLYFITAFAFFEGYTPLGDHIRDFGSLVQTHGFYVSTEGDGGDVRRFGFRRPTLLSPEPSYAAYALSFLLTAAAIRYRDEGGGLFSFHLFFISIALIFLIRSPNLLPGLISVLFFISIFLLKKKRHFFMGIFLILVLLVAAYFLFEERVARLLRAFGHDGFLLSSEFVRVVGPLRILGDLMNSEYWMYGVGFSANVNAVLFSDLVLSMPRSAPIGNNSLVRILLIFGMIGIPLIVISLIILLQLIDNSTHRILIFILVIQALFLNGSVTSYLFWYCTFFVLGISKSSSAIQGNRVWN